MEILSASLQIQVVALPLRNPSLLKVFLIGRLLELLHVVWCYGAVVLSTVLDLEQFPSSHRFGILAKIIRAMNEVPL